MAGCPGAWGQVAYCRDGMGAVERERPTLHPAPLSLKATTCTTMWTRGRTSCRCATRPGALVLQVACVGMRWLCSGDVARLPCPRTRFTLPLVTPPLVTLASHLARSHPFQAAHLLHLQRRRRGRGDQPRTERCGALHDAGKERVLRWPVIHFGSVEDAQKDPCAGSFLAAASCIRLSARTAGLLAVRANPGA
jgi:hypothetical protein